MKIRSFFDKRKECEVVDTTTLHTIPDQSLTVREILTRFSRGTLVPPPVDFGEDDDIDADTGHFDDLVDADIAIKQSFQNLESIKNEQASTSEAKSQQSGDKAPDSGGVSNDSPNLE